MICTHAYGFKLHFTRFSSGQTCELNANEGVPISAFLKSLMATLVSCALISAVPCGGSMSASTAVGDSSGNIHEVLDDVTALIPWDTEQNWEFCSIFSTLCSRMRGRHNTWLFSSWTHYQRVLGQEFIYRSVTWLPLGLVDHSSVLGLGGSISVWSQCLINLSKFGKCPQIPSRKAWMNIFSTHQQLVEAVLGGIFPYD